MPENACKCNTNSWSKEHLKLGSGSLSSPMREHRNFAQFYCISIINFSTVTECLLLEFIWIKRTFSSHSYGCFYVCIACTSKNRQLIFYGRYLPFVRCQSRVPRHERKQSVCLSARWQNHTRCTQQYVVSLDWKLNADSSGVNAVVFYKHLWSLERILVGNSQKKPSILCNGAVVKGQDTGSGVNKMETTAGVWQQSGFICSAADNFQHTQNLHAHA